MASDPRAALDQFVVALQRHFEAASGRRSELDPSVVAAYDELAVAFVAYDDALFDAFDEVTPFDLTDEDDEDEDDDDYDDDDDDEDEDDEDDEDDDDEDDQDEEPAPRL
ncbi:DNA primase [Jannaschia sp. R86511]|uniref:DNA primase n=1 Tax=Jannaschia sp. R86511 TaxID=3093853 RepID=UPI0036D3FF3A